LALTYLLKKNYSFGFVADETHLLLYSKSDWSIPNKHISMLTCLTNKKIINPVRPNKKKVVFPYQPVAILPFSSVSPSSMELIGNRQTRTQLYEFFTYLFFLAFR
jgi:hypothetical protein